MDNIPKDKMGKRDNYLRGVFPFYDSLESKEMGNLLGINYALPLDTISILEVGLYIQWYCNTPEKMNRVLDKYNNWKNAHSTLSHIKMYRKVFDEIFEYDGEAFLLTEKQIARINWPQEKPISTEEVRVLYALLILDMLESFNTHYLTGDALWLSNTHKPTLDGLAKSFAPNPSKKEYENLLRDAFMIYRKEISADFVRQLFGSITLQERAAKANDIKNEHMRQVVAIIEKYISLNYASLPELFPPPRNGQRVNFTKLAEHIFWEELTQDLRIEFTPFYKLTKKPENKNFKKKDFMDTIKDQKKVYGTPFAPYKTIARKSREVLYTIVEKSTKF